MKKATFFTLDAIMKTSFKNLNKGPQNGPSLELIFSDVLERKKIRKRTKMEFF